MRKPNLFLNYSIVAVAAFSLAACGSDRNRTAQTTANGTETARNTAAGAGDDSSADRASGGSLSSGDRDFVTKAAQGGMAEVEIARLAEKNASNPKVKEYARHLMTDHTKVNDQLKSIAANANVTLPTDLDSKDRSEMDKLKEMAGAKFDREFVKHAVDDHETDIKNFEHEADKGSDPVLKSFASKTLVALRQHLEMARNIDSAQKGHADRSTR